MQGRARRRAVLGWPAAACAALLALGSGAASAAGEPSICGPGCPAPPRIRSFRFEGAAAARAAALRPKVAPFLDRPADEELLIRLVAALDDEPGLGGLTLRMSLSGRGVRTGRGETAELIVSADGQPRRVRTLALRVVDALPAQAPSPEGAGGSAEVDDASWRLRRQIEAEIRPFLLAPGRPMHPYFAELDTALVRQSFERRGYRDVQVTLQTSADNDLIGLTFLIAPGPRRTVSAMALKGAPDEPEDAREALTSALLQPGDDVPLVPARLARDAETVRSHFCRRGFSDAAVTTRQTDGAGGATTVTHEVAAGALYGVGSVVVTGFAVTPGKLANLPLREGGPYCADLLAETESALAAWMADRGHPDAQVSVLAVPLETASRGPRLLRVSIRIDADAEVRVARIFFEGNANTRDDVLRELLSVAEGDLYRERAVQASVQGLLRSGLFRRAEVESVEGGEPGSRYLIFRVAEIDPVSIDLREQSLTLRNLDLTHWPEDLDELAAGTAFRGAGQQLVLTAKSDHVGARFQNRFLHKYLLAEGGLDGRSALLGPAEERWLAAELAVGLKFFENRMAFLPILGFEATDLDRHRVFDALPIAQGSTVDVRYGGLARIDFNLRDAERLPYLGIDARAEYLRSAGALGGELTWHGLDAQGALNLPLAEAGEGAHAILRLSGRYARLWADGPVASHQRVLPDIRGYATRTIGLPFEGQAEDALGVVGGDRAATGSAELRLPITALRRNALAPFVDGATVAGAGDAFFDRLHLSSGLVWYFSFFRERLEGYLYGAYPFTASHDREWAGAGVGGSF